MNRRHLLKMGAGTLAVASLPKLGAQQASDGFRISDRVVARVPEDFGGLSYESPQLANPQFFAASNKELVRLFRELAPTGGVLRLGGNLSAFTGWHDQSSMPLTDSERAMMERGKKYWEWDLTDPTIKNGSREAVFTPECIDGLASFLNATGWKLIYGLNFGLGTEQQAATEAAYVQKAMGQKLIAFQLGNEVDFWRGGFRSKDWECETFLPEWESWIKAIRVNAPDAPFAGPDVAVRLDWAEKLAHSTKDVVLLSGHHYAMGPAGDPRMTGEHLLGPDAEVLKEIETAQQIKVASGKAFRNTECNSCFHGGQKGVSDSYASALWVADYMLTLAQGGHAGVNLHGGGEGIYSAIVGDKAKGFVRRPLYFGMQFAQSFAGTDLLESKLSGSGSIRAYAGQKGREVTVALINKSPSDAAVMVHPTDSAEKKRAEVWKLSGKALDSREDVAFAPADSRPDSEGSWLVPAYSALLLKFV